MEDYPIKLGTLLFTMVEPEQGHEVEYNRWYEHDHFYSGCMVGAWQFAGDRFVATRRMKALRYPAGSDMTADNQVGSYLAIYWVLEGKHDEWNEWAVEQVNWLHQNGRMFEAAHAHPHAALREAVGGAHGRRHAAPSSSRSTTTTPVSSSSRVT